jgi:hypothetical protein
MNTRDKAILDDLRRFRCLTRDDIAELHFSHTKHPVTHTNTVLKRLRRDGLIKCSTERIKYVYFPGESKMKTDSQKMNHFLAIAQFFREIRAHEQPRIFEVEPKIGPQGFAEPDIFTIWKGMAFFVEVQRTVYTDKVMQLKLDRYESFYNSGAWQRESWQPPEKKIFPNIWIIGEGNYKVVNRPFRVLQDDIPGLIAKIPKRG